MKRINRRELQGAWSWLWHNIARHESERQLQRWKAFCDEWVLIGMATEIKPDVIERYRKNNMLPELEQDCRSSYATRLK